jgi:acetyl esterase
VSIPNDFNATKRSIEDGIFVSDSRTDVDNAALIARDPRLGTVSVRKIRIPARDGTIVSARSYVSRSHPMATLVWAHGGAFIGGDLDMPEANWVSLCLAARGIHVLSVAYRKALRGVTFPAPSDDVVDAWNWAIDHVDELGGNDRSVHIGGASAGGNLAAGAALRLRDGEGMPPASVVLLYPTLHELLPAASPALAASVGLLPEEQRFRPEYVREMNSNYSGARGSSPYTFPGSALLEGFPPVFVLNSERDDLRASGEQFAADAVATGVEVRVEFEPNTSHGHLNQPHSAEGARSIARMADWIIAHS